MSELGRLSALAEKHGFVVVPASPATAEPTPAAEDQPGEAAYRRIIRLSELRVKSVGQPQELSAIFDYLTDLGVRIGGERPKSTLSAYLSDKSSNLESISKGMYWLKGVPVPSSPANQPEREPTLSFRRV